MLIAACTLFSCGGDDPVTDDPIKPEQPDKPDIQTKRIKSMTVYYPGKDYLTEQTLSYDDKDRINKIETYISDRYRDNFITSISYDNNQITSITKNHCKHSNPTDLNCDYGGLSCSYNIQSTMNNQGFILDVTYFYKDITNNEQDQADKGKFNYKDGYLDYSDFNGDNVKYIYANNNLISFIYNYSDGNSETNYISYTKYENKLGISPLFLTEDYRFIDMDIESDYYTFGLFFAYYSGWYGKTSKYLEEKVGSCRFEYELDKDGYPVKIISKDFDEDGQYDENSDESFTVNIIYQE
ncbi:hypothetical protein DXD68_14515 [Parabacteroides sp. TM07-1AC]|nr:hypothetical protein DXD68_14515 [Parabacteroides sp. TM07-1AC]